VTAHEHLLLIGERPALAQDRIGDGDLPGVAEQGRLLGLGYGQVVQTRANSDNP
jgi:hypothetical protein